ncbi:unnamed protein product [Cylicocyclus nassatus]|uniref:Uncharacterized protein n=1 Tax=Cylicocyclus nassatus TaxID=53992 RepID=A0AA36H2C9_CYLNA|nr:unnamed protein product [Cylicocyclus nassatus]
MRLDDFSQSVKDKYSARVQELLAALPVVKQDKFQGLEFKNLQPNTFENAKLPFTVCILLPINKGAYKEEEKKTD